MRVLHFTQNRLTRSKCDSQVKIHTVCFRIKQKCYESLSMFQSLYFLKTLQTFDINLYSMFRHWRRLTALNALVIT